MRAATATVPSRPPTSTAASLGGDRAWRLLVEAAAGRYRSAGRHAFHAARGKLRLDPVFRHLLETGLITPRSRVVDIGCGRGLVASLLQSCHEFAGQGSWPARWSAPPLDVALTGLDADPVEIRRATAALAGRPPLATFHCADMRTAALPSADTVLLIDVLHYIAAAEQDALLARVRAALPVGGRLLLRVGDATAPRGWRRIATRWLDLFGVWWRGLAPARQHLRGLPAWRERLEALGFEVESRPMSAGTPFVNVLLVGTVRG